MTVQSVYQLKKEIISILDGRFDYLKKISNTILAYAEPPLQEYRSSSLLKKELMDAGFTVSDNPAGLKTAFVATWGAGKPVLATYCEYDATEGLSQKPVPYQAPMYAGAGGFPDMHNGLGAGALGAALVLKEILEKNDITGTIKVFGTPAEKLCVGKPYMARAGLFKDLNGVIGWHPGDKTDAEPGWGYNFLALQGEKFIFKGSSVYGAKPWQGTSALDGLSLMDVAVQYLREHILPPDAYFTINSIVSDGGQAPTNLPGRAEAWYHIRALDRGYVEKIMEGLSRCAQGASIATQTEYSTEFVTATWENLPNVTLAKAMHKNIELIGAPKMSEQDKDFVREVEKSLGYKPTKEPFDLSIDPPSGKLKIGAADDFTEFSWIVPTHRVYVTYNAVRALPSWCTAAFASMNIGHQAMITGAKLVACLLLDLFLDSKLLEASKKEFEKQKQERKREWHSLIPADKETPWRDKLPDEHYKKMTEECKISSIELLL